MNTYLERPIVADETYLTLGFSLRDLRDAVILFHFALSLAMSVYLWRAGRYREWCILLWVLIFVIAAQAFVFVPNQRYSLVFFSYPGLLLIALGSWAGFESYFKVRLAHRVQALIKR